MEKSRPENPNSPIHILYCTRESLMRELMDSRPEDPYPYGWVVGSGRRGDDDDLTGKCLEETHGNTNTNRNENLLPFSS